MKSTITKIMSIVLIMCFVILTFNANVNAATIKLNKTKVTLTVGETTTLKAIGTTKSIKWTSSKKSVATVSNKGIVTAKDVGTTNITATVNNKRYICKVTVKFDTATTIKSISTKFKGTDKGIIAILTNNNKYPISLSATMVFYDESGAMIGKSTDDNYFFEAGKQCALNFTTPYDDDYNSVNYYSYKINYTVKKVSYMTSNLSDIKTKSNFGSNSIMVEVTNSGNRTSEFTIISIIYYKDGKAVNYDYTYANVNAPGSIDYISFMFPYDNNYDTIQIDDYEIYVNSSYCYN